MQFYKHLIFFGIGLFGIFANADVTFIDVKLAPNPVVAALKDQTNFCDQDSKWAPVLKKVSFQYDAVYTVTGIQLYVSSIYFQDQNGKELNVYSEDGTPLKIYASGAGTITNSYGVSFKVYLKDICELNPSEGFPIDDLVKYIGRLNLVSKISQ